MLEGFFSEARSKEENAKAIELCLVYLASEARNAGLTELADIIQVAAMAAAGVTVGAVH